MDTSDSSQAFVVNLGGLEILGTPHGSAIYSTDSDDPEPIILQSLN